MTLDEIIQEVMDLLEAGFNPDIAVAPSSTLSDIGFDSLDAIELLLLLEERWPHAMLEDYEPGLATTVKEIAEEVQRRLDT